jgi:hypothetical protein
MRYIPTVLIAAAAMAMTPSGAALSAPAKASGSTLTVCHGYNCAFKARLALTAGDAAKVRSIMAAGEKSAAAERTAIARAVRHFEERSTQQIGIRDKPKTQLGASRIRGQMDCVDESTNTRTLLNYLAGRGLLKHHKVGRNDSRGFLLDGRYPHWTASIVEASGNVWAVDSWYGAGGAAPDVMPMSEWKSRGYGGS